MLSYLACHWRGELPLAVAWWVNGVALTALALAFDFQGPALGLALQVDSRAGLDAYLAFGLGYFLLLPAWQMIGVFRAADRHVAGGGTVLAARLTQSAATLLTILLAARFMVFVGESVPALRLNYGPGSHYSVALSHDGRVLEVSGSFSFGLAATVERMLAANPGVRRVRLESSGGALSEARQVRELIIARRLDTDSRIECSSACVSAYIGGRRRLLHRSARMGLHLPRNPGFGLRGTVPAGFAEELAYFGSRGTPRWFLERWIAGGRQFWYPTHEELRRAGIVHGFYGRGQHAQRQ